MNRFEKKKKKYSKSLPEQRRKKVRKEVRQAVTLSTELALYRSKDFSNNLPVKYFKNSDSGNCIQLKGKK